MREFNILFCGTPDFAVESLRALIGAGENIAGVITRSDRQRGRGLKKTASPVKQYAMSQSIPVYQPETLKDNAISGLLNEIKPSLIAVVAYGKILPSYVLDYPEFGCINLHGSLLPKYRGAAPVFRAIMNGESETGVTTMRMDSGLDTGDILLQERIPVGEDQTAGEVFETLARIGGKLLVKTVSLLREGMIAPRVQDHSIATYAEKITPRETQIDWAKSALSIHNQIRGLSPCPGAYTTVCGRILKICCSCVRDMPRDPCSVARDAERALPGQVVRFDRGGFIVKCGSGFLKIISCKPEGKGMMSAADMINGRKLDAGDLLGT